MTLSVRSVAGLWARCLKLWVTPTYLFQWEIPADLMELGSGRLRSP